MVIRIRDFVIYTNKRVVGFVNLGNDAEQCFTKLSVTWRLVFGLLVNVANGKNKINKIGKIKAVEFGIPGSEWFKPP